MLFLTYHKISERTENDADFYTVTRSQISQQLQSLQAAGYKSLPLHDLAERRTSVEKTFVLSFDDGTADHFTIAIPVLREFDQHAIFFVPTAKLNQPDRLTDDQLRRISDSGHVIGCHSHDHRRLDVVSETELRYQLRTSCEKLEQITGKQIWAFAPPGGFTNNIVRAAALGTGLNVIRTMRWGFNRRLDFTNLETIPVNRHTNEQQFQKILAGKQPHLLYFGKQAAKALVPSRTYERLRGWIFKIGRQN